MKSLVLTIILFSALQIAAAQPWIEKSYTYDSLLNVTYGTAIDFNGGIDTLEMDIFLPDCGDSLVTTARPLLMWIHGGAFIAGSKDEYSIQTMCREFAKRGYVTASINYRLGFVSDDVAWNCNYPNYECLFATDSSEWARSYYRAVQDAKGALRFLINRHEEYHIDPDNVFVAGESAGAFTALGVGLLDTLTERMPHTYAIADAPIPHSNALGCGHNEGQTFTGTSIPRPDLGGIDGTIEPTNIPYTIKGIGNIYGGMLVDLLKEIPQNKPKPAIYSFHQPCDIIVSIDSNYALWGLSWCFTNGYNCYGISNNEIMMYGSRMFSNWNASNNYGYVIQNEFTSVNFPFNFFFGSGSCLDQANNPCHAYDSRALRENNLAAFFADKISIDSGCGLPDQISHNDLEAADIVIAPNPAMDNVYISGPDLHRFEELVVYDLLGHQVLSGKINGRIRLSVAITDFSAGVYLVQLRGENGSTKAMKFVKR